METQFKNSFIPKKPIDVSGNLRTTRSSKHIFSTIFSLIGTLIFVATLAGYGATFVWQIKLRKNIDSQVVQLKKARDEFNDSFIQEATRLNNRIVEAKSMLDNHVSPSSLYAMIEKKTLQTVSFSKFSFKDNEDGTLTVSGSGDALRYESIVLQSDAFGKSGFLRNVIFTDLKADDTNRVVGFSFEATLDPQLIMYRNSLPGVTNESN